MLNSDSLKMASTGFKQVEDRNIPSALTDVGCERDLNEDRYAVIESEAGLVWLVCDGMGGVKGGELAAQLVIDGMKRYLGNSVDAKPADALKRSILEANRIIVLRRQNQAFGQMGTTIVGAIFNGREVHITHVGDSRAYVVGQDSIKQLTEDHTYVQQLVNNDKISMEDAMSHPQAHVLTKAIGSDPALELDVSSKWIWTIEDSQEQDYLVLCTDGLYSMVSDDEIAEFVNSNSPQNATAKLTELAKQRGGYDNITIAIIPLVGHLKDTVPANYTPVRVKKTRGEVKKLNFKELTPFLLKNLLMVIGLSLISLVLVFVVVLFSLSNA